MSLRNQKGSALYTVLILSTAAIVLILVYIKTQYAFSGPSIRKSHSLQALLNARSGIWYGLELIKENAENSFSKDSKLSQKAINDSIFSSDLFSEKKNEDDKNNNVFDSLISLIPYDSSFGKINLNIEKDDFYITLRSEGVMRKTSSVVEAQIASRPFTNTDTVLYLGTVSPVKGMGYVGGRTAFESKSIDSTSINSEKRFHVDKKGLRNFVLSYEESLASNNDTAIKEMPLTVFYEDEFDEIEDTIKGPLFFDGSSRDLIINGKGKTIIVYDELQFTGTVILNDITFIVGGDIKLLDEANLKNVTLFTKSRLYIADKSRLNGTALSKGVIEIYGESSVEEQSLLISMGAGLKPVKPKIKEKVQETKNTVKTDSLSTRLFSVNIRDKASVDGILIDMGKATEGGISTAKETLLRGVLWSEGTVCHRGELEGVIKAKVLVDDDHLTATTENFLEGDVKTFEGIEHYLFPIYFGKPVLIDWREL